MSWLAAAAPAIGSIGSTILGGIMGGAADKRSAKEQRRMMRDQRQFQVDWDIGIPFHKLGTSSRERIWADTQRGQDMDTATNLTRMQDQAGIQRQQETWKYNALRNEGATLQEIMGTAPAGGVSSSPGSAGQVMGNQASTMQAKAADVATQNAQMKFQAQQNAADRQTTLAKAVIESGQTLGSSLGKGLDYLSQRRGQDVQMRGQDVQLTTAQIQAQASEKVASIAASANITSSSIIASAQRDVAKMVQSTEMAKLKEVARMNDVQYDNVIATTGLLLQDKGHKAIQFSERWAKRLSEMSPENAVTSGLMLLSGVDPETLLLANGGDLTPEQLEAVNDFASSVLARNSLVAKNLAGGVFTFGSIPDLLRQGVGLLGRGLDRVQPGLQNQR